ncbi:MAG TPA: AraC family transcriptional regulator [Phenylobacterium sp.]
MRGAQIVSALVRAPAGMVEHAAADAHVLTVHAEGRIPAAFDCGGLKLQRILTPGDIDLLPADTPARLVDEGANGVLILVIPATLVARHADELGRAADRLRPLAGLRDPVLSDLAWRIQRRRNASPELYDDCLAEELVGRLLRRHDPQLEPPSSWSRGLLSGRRLRRVLDLIEGEIDGPLPISRLADAAGLGPTAFKAAFRQALGEPVHRYVVRRRAQRARVLLLEGNLPASHVALDVGFSHQSHMAHWLRRLFGMLPTELEKLGLQGATARRWRES